MSRNRRGVAALAGISVLNQTNLSVLKQYVAPAATPLADASQFPKVAGVPENFIGPDKLTKYTDSSEEIFRTLFR